jgi:hypothetical protein
MVATERATATKAPRSGIPLSIVRKSIFMVMMMIPVKASGRAGPSRGESWPQVKSGLPSHCS